MQQRRELDQVYTNRKLLNGQLDTPKWWLPTVVTLGLIVMIGIAVILVMVNKGLGVTGLARPVYWGLFITTFVFWVGISHAGIMISAILRLTQAEWRRPVTRAAELLTVFSLLTALVFPLIHAGRPWRIAYWIMPYDVARGIYPNIRSPLIMDPVAIGTYLTGSTLFLYIALLPDLGNLRDRTTGWRNAMYTVLSLGWRGNPRQWKMQTVGGILLSALMLPIFVSVHSIVSWDFAIASAVEGWHSTIFAPYFVIGAVHSGVSAVVTMMALMRWLWKWDDFIRPEHFDALARLLIVVATGWLGFTFLELTFALYGQDAPEIALREMQMFQWPWNGLFILFFLTAYAIPVPMWLFKRVRTNIALMFWTSILVNIGMWLERFLIIVPGLARRTPFVYTWEAYRPSPVEWTIFIWSFAWVTFLMLLFSKFFPLVPLFEQKESQVFTDDVMIGRAKVPAIVREAD
ncbi:MAG TPA: molybdopterin oxidoreductase [Dehalococcoidia bacterium]|nr:molybdopterin oxidoreductase [Dehalococcoidia bacterium]HIK89598.1 molybdopterin oxidoreductase [Dehalococcoidia bacterium]